MPNNSATGGYLVPTATQPLPGSLTLTQFIQSVIVGVTALTGASVRPNFQVAPPKQPDITEDWISFGIKSQKKDTYAAVTESTDGTQQFLNRQESLEIEMHFYGPNAQSIYSAFSDGMQIPQNLEALRLANMGFTEVSEALRGPDLVNERWVERYIATMTLVRQVVRTYPILSFASVVGSLNTVVAQEEIEVPFQQDAPEESP